MIQNVHSGSGSWFFFPIPDPGSRDQKGTAFSGQVYRRFRGKEFGTEKHMKLKPREHKYLKQTLLMVAAGVKVFFISTFFFMHNLYSFDTCYSKNLQSLTWPHNSSTSKILSTKKRDSPSCAMADVNEMSRRSERWAELKVSFGDLMAISYTRQNKRCWTLLSMCNV